MSHWHAHPNKRKTLNETFTWPFSVAVGCLDNFRGRSGFVGRPVLLGGRRMQLGALDYNIGNIKVQRGSDDRGSRCVALNVEQEITEERP